MIGAVEPAAEPAALQDQVADLLGRVGTGDEQAFAELYDLVAGWIYGLALKVVRDPSQSEEVAQEVLLEIWRMAARYDRGRGSGRAWVMTLAHRRAVDRVRSTQAGRDRDTRDAELSRQRPHDSVVEEVTMRLDRERVRRHLAGLTDLQRQAIELAYFKGYTQREVAEVLDVPLGTVKTRMRDGLIRLRDAMGVTA